MMTITTKSSTRVKPRLPAARGRVRVRVAGFFIKKWCWAGPAGRQGRQSLPQRHHFRAMIQPESDAGGQIQGKRASPALGNSKSQIPNLKGTAGERQRWTGTALWRADTLSAREQKAAPVPAVFKIPAPGQPFGRTECPPSSGPFGCSLALGTSSILGTSCPRPLPHARVARKLPPPVSAREQR